MSLLVRGARRMTELHPPLGGNWANHYYFRYDWVTTVTVESSRSRPTWRITGGVGAGSSLIRSRSDRQMVFNRPPSPMAVNVSDGQDTATIWFVSATLEIYQHGMINPADNPRWPEILAALRRHYGAPSYTFDRLGLIQFPSSGQSFYDSFDGIRYGDSYEMIGQVEPHDIQRRIPIPFVVLRRRLGGFVAGVDSAGRPLPENRGPRATISPGTDDTSTFQSGELDANGRLFDYDFPGSVMTPASQIGDRHTFQVHFQAMVAIGSVGMAQAWTRWPEATRLGTGVSPPVQWRTQVIARCTQHPTPGEITVGLSS